VCIPRSIPSILVALLGTGLLAEPSPENLLDLSIDQLMRITVTTSSRTETELAHTPAAMFVITAEDLKRCGARDLPDALRLVPGMQVAQIESDKWAVSSRGYDGRFACQMQVLVDGRSVYSSLFSGTPWEMLNIPLEEVERIEVIRGPGGSVWGSNAVSGVVNIITKPITRQPSTRLTLAIGTEERARILLQQSGALGESVAYRAYAQGFDRDTGGGREGLDPADDWREGRFGLHLEWTPTPDDRVTFQGDYYRGVFGQTLLISDPAAPAQWPGPIAQPEDLRGHGGFFMADWRHALASDSYWSLRAYYEDESRDELSLDDRRHSYGIEFDHRFTLWDGRHDILWGICGHLVRDTLHDTEIIQFSSEHDTIQGFCVFAQDEITLVPERLHLTVGSRFELTDRNGWAPQPSARLAFTPTRNQTWWLAVSRAVRVPSRMELTGRRWLVRGLTLVGKDVWNYSASFVGNPDLDPEQLTAYELGARFLLHPSASLDLAVYYHDFSDAVSPVYGGSDVGAGSLDEWYVVENALDVSTYGFEAAFRYRPTDWWQLDLAYTFTRVQMHPREGFQQFNDDWFEKDVPKQQLSILSSFRIAPTVGLNLWGRYVDAISDVGGYEVDAYVTLDANIRWQITPRCDLLLAGQNLLESSHNEYYPSTLLPTASTSVQRAFLVQLSYRF
jgi:iron complex outermembrane receptor protein